MHRLPLPRFFIGNWSQEGFLSEGRPTRTLREILTRLKETYCGPIGYEVCASVLSRALFTPPATSMCVCVVCYTVVLCEGTNGCILACTCVSICAHACALTEQWQRQLEMQQEAPAGAAVAGAGAAARQQHGADGWGEKRDGNDSHTSA